MIRPEQTDAPATAIERVGRALASVEQGIASLALAAALFISLYAILMRALHVPTGEWVLELPIEFLLVIAVYGSGALLARRAHMRVAFLVSRLGPRPALVCALFVQLLLVCICVLLTSRAVVAAGQASRAGMHRAELFGMPESLVAWTAAAGFLLWTIHALASLVEIVRRGAPADAPASPMHAPAR